jgi:hypothetical protein
MSISPPLIVACPVNPIDFCAGLANRYFFAVPRRAAALWRAKAHLPLIYALRFA